MVLAHKIIGEKTLKTVNERHVFGDSANEADEAQFVVLRKVSSKGEKSGSELGNAFVSLFANVFDILIVEFVSKCAWDQISREFERDFEYGASIDS